MARSLIAIPLACSATPESDLADAACRVAIASVGPLARSDSGESEMGLALRKELESLGRTIEIEEYSGEGNPNRLSDAIRRLASRPPCLSVGDDVESIRLLREVVGTRRLLFRLHLDVARIDRLLNEEARADRRVSGVTSFANVDTKLADLALDAYRVRIRLGYLYDSRESTALPRLESMRDFAKRRRVDLIEIDYKLLTRPTDLGRELAKRGVEALVVPATSAAWRDRREVAAQIGNARLPAVFERPMYVRGLSVITFGPAADEVHQRLGDYARRVVRGADSSRLPIVRPSRFELVVSRPAMVAQHIVLPLEFLARADRILE